MYVRTLFRISWWALKTVPIVRIHLSTYIQEHNANTRTEYIYVYLLGHIVHEVRSKSLSIDCIVS